jgi:hypothetical protein
VCDKSNNVVHMFMDLGLRMFSTFTLNAKSRLPINALSHVNLLVRNVYDFCVI